MHTLKAGFGQALFGLDLQRQRQHRQLHPQLGLEQLQTARRLLRVIQQFFLQQVRVGLAHVGLGHTALEQAVGQPLGSFGALEGDVAGGVGKAGQVFQGQFGQGQGDRVHFAGDKASLHRDGGGNHAIECQLDILRAQLLGSGLSAQTGLQGVVGKLPDRVNAVQKVLTVAALAGQHQVLEQARIGDAVGIVGLGKPVWQGAAQGLLQGSQAGNEPATWVGDVVQKPLVLPRQQGLVAVDAVDVAQLLRQVTGRQGIEGIALNVLDKPLAYRTIGR